MIILVWKVEQIAVKVEQIKNKVIEHVIDREFHVDFIPLHLSDITGSQVKSCTSVDLNSWKKFLHVGGYLCKVRECRKKNLCAME